MYRFQLFLEVDERGRRRRRLPQAQLDTCCAPEVELGRRMEMGHRGIGIDNDEVWER